MPCDDCPLRANPVRMNWPISRQTVSSRAQDACGKRLVSCQKRFGVNAELPFGGFPAAGLIR
ncbi:hypothetical protein [Limnohabitans sp. MMS-10A-160]|uniref:hypothetical protein n=1 Tax=Limnohabitans sp. MMS-10A-160 TaxID=1835766 RepID=UPI000D376D99